MMSEKITEVPLDKERDDHYGTPDRGGYVSVMQVDTGWMCTVRTHGAPEDGPYESTATFRDSQYAFAWGEDEVQQWLKVELPALSEEG